MWETCPEFLRRSARPRLEPATSRSRIRRSTATPRRHPRAYERTNDVSTSVRINYTAANRALVPTVQGNHVPVYHPCRRHHPVISSLPYHHIMKSEIMKSKHEMAVNFQCWNVQILISNAAESVWRSVFVWTHWECSQSSYRQSSWIKKESKLWPSTESAVPTKWSMGIHVNVNLLA